MWRSATFGVHFSSRPCYRLVVIVSITPAMYICFISNFPSLWKIILDRPAHTREPIYTSDLLLHGVFFYRANHWALKKKKWHSTCIRFLIFNLDLQLEEICKKFWTKKRQNGPMYKTIPNDLWSLHHKTNEKLPFKLFNCKMHLND